LTSDLLRPDRHPLVVAVTIWTFAGAIAIADPRWHELRGVRKGQVLAIAAWDGWVGFQLATVLKRVFSG
jgi:hypothetical protein